MTETKRCSGQYFLLIFLFYMSLRNLVLIINVYQFFFFFFAVCLSVFFSHFSLSLSLSLSLSASFFCVCVCVCAFVSASPPLPFFLWCTTEHFKRCPPEKKKARLWPNAHNSVHKLRKKKRKVLFELFPKSCNSSECDISQRGNEEREILLNRPWFVFVCLFHRLFVCLFSFVLTCTCLFVYVFTCLLG